MFKKLIFIMILTSIQFVYSAEFSCELNIAQPGQDINQDNIDKFIRKFSYSPSKKGDGTQIQLGEVTLFLWEKSEMLNVVLKVKSTEHSVKTSYRIDQDLIDIRLKKFIQLTCKKGVLEEKKVTIEGKDLFQFKENLKVMTKKDFILQYYQTNVQGMMRPIIFQVGKRFSVDEKYSQQEDRCQFLAQLQFNEDITVENDSEFIVYDISVHQNNETHKVLTYSFINPTTNRTTQLNPYYSPFSFSCRISNNHKLTPSDILRITGGVIEVQKID
jgi:hypothetical protein